MFTRAVGFVATCATTGMLGYGIHLQKIRQSKLEELKLCHLLQKVSLQEDPLSLPESVKAGLEKKVECIESDDLIQRNFIFRTLFSDPTIYDESLGEKDRDGLAFSPYGWNTENDLLAIARDKSIAKQLFKRSNRALQDLERDTQRAAKILIKSDYAIEGGLRNIRSVSFPESERVTKIYREVKELEIEIEEYMASECFAGTQGSLTCHETAESLRVKILHVFKHHMNWDSINVNDRQTGILQDIKHEKWWLATQKKQGDADYNKALTKRNIKNLEMKLFHCTLNSISCLLEHSQLHMLRNVLETYYRIVNPNRSALVDKCATKNYEIRT